MQDHTAEIVVASCERTSLADLHAGFCTAFADYPVAMQPSISEFSLMLAQRGFDKALSRVALAGRSVVSFWLIGRQDAETASAYVIATGTAPGFRGCGLALGLHQNLQKPFTQYGIRSVQLEVISSNRPARSLYAKLGYLAVRDLRCLEIDRTAIKTAAAGRAIVAHCSLSDMLCLSRTFCDWQPSWQNDMKSLSRISENLVCVAAQADGAPVAYGVLIEPTGTVAQLAVEDTKRRTGVGSAILQALAAASPRDPLKIINADSRDPGFQAFLAHHGAHGEITQTEMVLSL